MADNAASLVVLRGTTSEGEGEEATEGVTETVEIDEEVALARREEIWALKDSGRIDTPFATKSLMLSNCWDATFERDEKTGIGRIYWFVVFFCCFFFCLFCLFYYHCCCCCFIVVIFVIFIFVFARSMSRN